jgi:sugar lactone lactonase YvrE
MRIAVLVAALALVAPTPALASGTILFTGEYGPRRTTAPGRAALVAVDERSGAIAILSDFHDPRQGPTGALPYDVAIGADGTVYVLDREAGPLSRGIVFRVDPRSGRRTMLSELGDPAFGPMGQNPESIAIGPSGTIYVADIDAGPGDGDVGAILAVDPASGSRGLLSAFGDAQQGPALGEDPRGIAVLPDETVLVLDSAALYAVDPGDGARTVVSRFDEAAQGPPLVEPHAVAVGAKGEILVLDRDHAPRVGADGERRSGGVLRVDLTDGTRRLVSGFGDGRGSVVRFPTDVAAGPAGALYVTAEAASSFGATRWGVFSIGLRSRRPALLADLGALGTDTRPPTPYFGYGAGAAYHPARLVACTSLPGDRRCAGRLSSVRR